MPPHVRILINESSGSSGDGNSKQDEILSLFQAHGVTPQIILLNRTLDVRALARTPNTLLVAAGGDGTVNCVAAAVAGTATPMAVLPIGTLNHFAKDLNIPIDLPAAVALIASFPSPTAVDAAEVNGQIFVNNSSLGFYPSMVAQRDVLKKKLRLNKWFSMAYASAAAFIRFRQLTVSLTIDGKKASYTTPFLFVGNNEYKMEGPDIGTREHLDRGRLYLYLAPGISRLGLLRLSLAALLGKVRDVSNYREFCVGEFTVNLRKRHTRVSRDGEVRKLRPPLVYRVLPATLHVITPGT